jgi:hypothetical protein
VPYQFRYKIESKKLNSRTILYRIDSDSKSELGYKETPIAIISETPELETVSQEIVYSSEKIEAEGFSVEDKEDVFNY